jgi:hypothetical protein
MPDATIRDVARRAQVSVASVSRVLNQIDNVSEETKARVTDAVRLLKDAAAFCGWAEEIYERRPAAA